MVLETGVMSEFIFFLVGLVDLMRGRADTLEKGGRVERE